MLGFGLGDSSVFIYNTEKPIGFAITITVIAVISLAGLVRFQEKGQNATPSLSQAQKIANYEFNMKNDLREIFKNKGFICAWLAAGLFIAYTVDVSKGLANIVQLGNGKISDLEGITVFFFMPGFFSVMIPSFYLGRGIPHYRTVFLIIMLLSLVCKCL